MDENVKKLDKILKNRTKKQKIELKRENTDENVKNRTKMRKTGRKRKKSGKNAKKTCVNI